MVQEKSVEDLEIGDSIEQEGWVQVKIKQSVTMTEEGAEIKYAHKVKSDASSASILSAAMALINASKQSVSEETFKEFLPGFIAALAR